MPSIDYAAHRDLLIEHARDAMRHCIAGLATPTINKESIPECLLTPGACFVTLRKNDELRGCIGSLQAYRPLLADIVENACAAALQDPRFPQVSSEELEQLHIQISILSKPEPLAFSTEQDLLAQLRPGIDGLILKDNSHRATFLPSVWDSLPDKHDFLNELKRKAGLPYDYWSNTIEFSRYTTDSI